MQEVPCPDNPSRTVNQYTYNHSWQEIYDALSQGRLVVAVNSGEAYAEMILIGEARIGDAVYVAVADGLTPLQFPDTNSLVYTETCDK